MTRPVCVLSLSNLSHRAGPRLQIIAEGGMDLLEADKNWGKSRFPKILKLAERLKSEAQPFTMAQAHEFPQPKSIRY
jgi:hypothetical protein